MEYYRDKDSDIEAQPNDFNATSQQPSRRRSSIMPSLVRYKLLCMARVSNSKLISKLLTLVLITSAGFWTLSGMPYPDTLAPTLHQQQELQQEQPQPQQHEQPPLLLTEETFEQHMGFDVDYGRNLITIQDDEYDFEWHHWVNLTDYSSLNNKTEEEIETFLLGHVDKPTFQKPPKIPASTAQWRRLGQTYLREHAAPPAKIIDLGSNKTYVLHPKNLPREPKLTMVQQMWEKAAKMVQSSEERARLENEARINMTRLPEDYQIQMYKVYKEIEEKGLLGPVPGLSVNRQPLLPDLNPSLFEFNATSHLTANDTMSLETKFRAIQTGKLLSNLSGTPKHFYEISIPHEGYLSVHYDWRFFRHIRKGDDSHASLHHLLHAWSAFARSEGVVSWIAHGTLIGWRWNGLNLDWDSDIDLQMPVQELDRLARRYNNTLVIQDPKDGTGRYLIDVAPAYVDRINTNGNNVIDARFIDIRSGLFLDITGLGVTAETIAAATGKEAGHTLVGCKNKHMYRVEEVLPLRQTLHEGTPVYIPNAVDKVLSREYVAYQIPSFEHYRFHAPLRMWIREELHGMCQSYLDPTLRYSEAEVSRDNEEGVTLYGACDNLDMLNQFKRTSRMTWVHAQELSYWEGLSCEFTSPEVPATTNYDNYAENKVDEGKVNTASTGMLMTGWQGSHEELVQQYEDLCAGYVAEARVMYESPRYLPESVQDV